jgi:tetratricopeptide (TPR) repeat protein
MHLAEDTGHPRDAITAAATLGLLCTLRGDLGRAVPVLERALGIIRERNIRQTLPAAAAFLGHAYALSGQVSQGIELLEEGLDVAAAIGFLPCNSLWVGWLGAAYLAADRVEDASRAIQSALDLSRERKERGYHAYALRLLGELAAGSNAGVETAADHYRRAMALASELGMRPLVAHCHLGLGKLYRRTERGERAGKYLTIATTMYREMGMGFWLEQAEAAMKEP